MWPYWHFVSCLFSMISERKTWVRKKWDRMKFYIVWERREVRKEVFDGTYTPKKKKTSEILWEKRGKSLWDPAKKIKMTYLLFCFGLCKNIIRTNMPLQHTLLFFFSFVHLSIQTICKGTLCWVLSICLLKSLKRILFAIVQWNYGREQFDLQCVCVISNGLMGQQWKMTWC